MANAEHIVPGLNDPTCGIAVAAKQLLGRGVGSDDEVWVHSMWTPMVVKASIKALLAGKRLIRMPHGCTDPTKLRYHWYKKRWVAPIERWLFRRADRVIATCEDEVNWITAFEPKVKKVEIVPLSFVPSAHISYHTSQTSSEPNQTPTRKLLYIGRLHPLKGVEYLLEAMPTDCMLVIIGKEEGEGGKLRKIVQQRHLDVEFRGVVNEDEKEAAYKWCDALVLPTLSENFGLVIAEALERGKRVITTDGAPAWGDNLTGLAGFTGLYSGYDGRLIYLKGYRNGTADVRVRLLKEAIRIVRRS